MIYFRILVKALFIAITIIFIAGCSEKDPKDNVMRIGTNVWPGYEPLYLARSLGKLNESQYRLVEYSNSTGVISAFRNGLIDAAGLTLDETLYLLQSGFDPKVVLVMDISHGGDAIISQNDIKSIKDLKGLRVGIENNALGAYVMTRALEINDMSKSDITTVSLSVDEHLRAFREKKVEAVVTFDPVRSELLQEGGQILFDSKDIPNEIVDVLVVKKEFLDNHTVDVNKLLDTWFETLTYMKKDIKAASKIISKRQKLNPEAVEASYEGLVLPQEAQNHLMLCKEKTLHITAKNLEKVMRENNLLQEKINVEMLFDSSEKLCK